MNQLLYKRGFLLTAHPVKNRSDYNIREWKKDKFAHFNLYVCSSVNTIGLKYKEIEIVCIGIIMDPIHNLINSEAILDRCIQALKNGQNQFWDYVDTLGGRFVFLLKHGENLIAFQDAVGTRSLFYSKSKQNNNILISSHSELLADILNLQKDKDAVRHMNEEMFKNNNNRYYPGLFTPYKDIYSLTPNTYLNMNTGGITRFFPRKSWKSEKQTTTTDDVAQLLKNQLKLLNRRYELAISLTGGLDSRLTLAASKEIRSDIYYYTTIYDQNHKGSNISTKYAKLLSETFNLDHHILSYEGQKDPDFITMFEKNTSHITTKYRADIAEILYHCYPEHKLHIKSNIVDISKAHSRRRFAFLPNESNEKVFAKLFGGYNNSEYVNQAMKYFIETTGLKKQNIFDYDLYDIFTWEHGNGKWQSLCLYEWDVVQDTVIIYNNRTVLKHFIFQSIREKKNKVLHKTLINKLWPELMNVEIEVYGNLPWKPITRSLKGLSLRLKLLRNR